jgi:hypothetical protein
MLPGNFGRPTNLASVTHGEYPMRIISTITLNKTTAAFFAAFLALPLASIQSAKAQNPESRDVAMQNCIATAQRQFPDSDTQSSARVSVYKACMTKAGHRP